MRTTLTIDEDVAARLRLLREERGLSFKELVNEALRSGLAALEQPTKSRPMRATSPVSLGGSRLADVDDVSGAIAIAEGDERP
jgi:Ribbon-helix-helix protein, copG family